jgi:ribosomal protein S18 acetylase RimI-like enzyme
MNTDERRFDIKTLKQTDFRLLYRAFLEAFSDYAVKMQPSEDQLLELFTRRGVDLSLSAGAFVDETCVGFTFNALDEYQNVMTAYDAGSGVVPAFRRKGISDEIFHYLLPQLKDAGAQNYVLEVIEQNTPAVKLYEKIGFYFVRRFDVFVGTIETVSVNSAFETREIPANWDYWRTIWDWEPSWQNSSASLQRSKKERLIRGIFLENRCIGYAIIFPDSGDVPQFCVERQFRGKGAGKVLIQSLQKFSTLPLRFINIDSSSEPTIRLLESCGIPKVGSQLEMRLIL